MNNEQLEHSIKSALENTSTNNFEAIKMATQQSKGVVLPMKNNKKWIKIVAIVAAFAIIFGGGFGVIKHQTAKKAITTVTLDVNPSIGIDFNKYNEVVSVNALNEDAKIILGDMDLVGLDSETAINALVGSMLTAGYLSDVQNSILVTVQSQKDDVAAKFQEEITTQIEGMLSNLSSGGNVLSQVISSSTDTTNLEKLADQYGISIGKANLIEQIIGSTEGLELNDLANKTINELSLIAETKGADIKDKIIQQGTASVEKYIDENSAQLIAVAEAGIKNLNVEGLKITKSDLTYNNGVICYDIGFEYQSKAFLVEVDASTGIIIDTETGKIGVELEIKDVNVEVKTGNDTVDSTVNSVANEVIDKTISDTKIKADADAPEVNSNDDGSVDVKTNVNVGDIEVPVELTLDAETVSALKESVKTPVKEIAKTFIPSNLSFLPAETLEAIIDTAIDTAVDEATIETIKVGSTPYYKVTVTIPYVNQEQSFFFDAGMNMVSDPTK